MQRIRNVEYLNSIDAVRELIYRQFPNAGPVSGLVVSDIDLVLRAYGPELNSDGRGRYLFAEFKHGPGKLTHGQNNTFRQIDEDLRASGSERYMGFWKVNYTLTPVHNDRELDRFEPACVQFDKCTQMYGNWNDPVIEIVGHEAVHRFLSTLDLAQALTAAAFDEPW